MINAKPSNRPTIGSLMQISKVARRTGFEPPTLGLEGPCSIQLSCTQIITEPRRRSGGSSRIRTCGRFPFEGLANPCHQPLGHGSYLGWFGRGRTSVCRDQSPMPYHLATNQKLWWKWVRFELPNRNSGTGLQPACFDHLHTLPNFVRVSPRLSRTHIS